jgi:3-phenylpropionate/cinnamic acid dioxygenase small subunit
MSGSQNEIEIRNALIDNYNAYAEGLDSKNWEMVRNCFADDVIIDYGELSAATGPTDAPRKADDWMNYLKGVINKFDITRHLITNHRVKISEDEVVCVAYLSADHVKFADPAIAIANPENVATVVGEYTNYYKCVDGQWKICRSALVVNWSSGNLALFV